MQKQMIVDKNDISAIKTRVFGIT